jgi:hypothetical protein
MPVWLRSFTYNKIKEAFERASQDTQPQTLDEQTRAIKAGEIELPDHSVNSVRPKSNIKY